MSNRLFRIAICFTLIFTLVFCEATMCFATNPTDAPKVTEAKAKASEVVLKDHAFAKGRVYAYTGNQIKPVLARIVVDVTYKKEDGTTETATKTITSFSKVTYKNNTSIGTGYAVTVIEGKTVEVPFEIKLGTVTNLKASPTSSSTIKLVWSKVPGAAGYVIYRSADGGDNYKRIKDIASGTTTSFSDAKRTLGETYTYKICPYREVGGKREYGEYSKAVSQRAQPAVPVISSVKRASYNSLKISWKKVPDASGYRIYRSTSAKGEYKRVATLKGNSKLSYTDKKRSCGKKYYYKVKAFKTSGLKRYYSYASAYKTGRTTPAKVRFNDETFSWYSSVDLCWNRAKGATGYVVYRSTSSKSGYKAVKTLNDGKKTKWVDKNLSGGTKYYYKVRSFRTVNGAKVYGAYSKKYTKYLVPKKLSTLIKKYEGVRYRFGGNTPKGWDCSGFVQWATYYLKGKKIGRTAGDQARGGKSVNKNNMSSWKPGDVLVYKRNGGGVSHVGLYIGGGKMMHALNSRYDTIIQDVDYYERWDGGNYLAAVRRY
ncbi:MAG: C40 family peptidase [Firmicutes bacterium]|nr:C40 family peptidase [Bacillota bacterium]MBR6799348.1 C40 family peptidase [Bacillota bacterium]